jgi:flagellar hook protein FlgE
MLGAIYIGLSGMEAYSKGLQTISNNVANLNTSGFKASSATFSDVFNYGGSGLSFSRGTDQEQAGGGIKFAAPQIDFKQGDLRQTNGDLDLAIQGSGLFVLLNGDKTSYTRTGQFAVGQDGYIAQQGTENRLAVLDDKGRTVALNIDSKRTDPPAATTTISFADNLSSSATTATVADVAVYDSLGGKHIWQIQFSRVADSVDGSWTVTVIDDTSKTVGTGKLVLAGGAVDPASSKLTITDAPQGAAALSVTLDFSSGVTGFSSGTTSTIRAASVDGNAVGALTGVTVDDKGQVKLAYSNTKTALLGAVALADFRNPQALIQQNGGIFTAQGSERPRLLASNVDGVGTIVSKEIEASNVDLSQQFGDLILVQRGFQASSQVVSVSNDMIQQLFGIRGQG